MAKLSTAVVLSDAEFAAAFDPALLVNHPVATESTLTLAAQAIVTSSVSKSDKIRQLLALGMTRGAVAKALNIRYQHVRNVELTPLKKAR
jgi:hypothetical protein